MLNNHLKSLLTSKLGFIPTKGQEKSIDHLSEFIASDEPDNILIIKGYAGTGKTSLIGALVSTLYEFNFKSILMAPTGRAAKVLANYSGSPAFTSHKVIYRQKSSPDVMGRFVLDKNLYHNAFFIVDEASMITNESTENSIFGTGRLLDDLIEYVY